MEYVVAKVVHVALAAMWFGGAILNLVLFEPILGKATYASRREITGRLSSALNKYFGAVGGLTLLSGIILVSLHPNGWTGLTTSPWGKAILFSIVGTFFALYLGGAAIRPSLRAIAKIQAQLGPEDEPPVNLRFLMARLRVTSWMVVILLAIVFIVMVYANQLASGPAH